MTNDVTLAFPDFSEKFYLTVDASDHSVGGILSQKDPNGNDRPVSFFIRKLLPAESRYETISKEALAIIHGLKVNRSYVLGHEIEILSDNKPLLWILRSQDASQRVARWRALLSEYEINISDSYDFFISFYFNINSIVCANNLP